jgi:hypothetical protein
LPARLYLERPFRSREESVQHPYSGRCSAVHSLHSTVNATACGLITEKECDECREAVQFYNACADIFEDNGLTLECVTEKLDPDCFNSDGDYMWEDDKCWELYPHSECESGSDVRKSCRYWKKSRRAALNFSDQRAYNQECRVWFWEDEWDEEDPIDEAWEAQECEEWLELIGFW